LMELFRLDGSWFWSNIVGRLLLGTVPGMDLLYRDGIAGNQPDMHDLMAAISPAGQLASLATPQIWIGAVAGAVMIYAAIQRRRPAAGRRLHGQQPKETALRKPTLILATLLLLPLAAQADDDNCRHSQPRDLALDMAGVRTVVFDIGGNDLDVRAVAAPGNR